MIKDLRLKNYELGFLILLIFLYFFTRLYRLTLWPIFCDEAIYVRWAQVMRNEPSLRFLPLQDGKQPLFMWLIMPALKIFSDPLFAGRFVSVVAGFLTMLGVGTLSVFMYRYMKTGLWAMFLYIITPFVLFFDRMALVDSLLSAFGIWSLVFSILLGRTKRLDVAMILGMVLGGALLTKSPAIFFVVLSPIIALLLNLKSKSASGRINLKSFLLLGVSLFFAFGIYNILRLGPNFHMIAIRNKDYVWSIAEVLRRPFDPLLPHLKDIWRYYSAYLTWPLFALGIVGIVVRIKKMPFLILIFWWLLPLLAQTAMAKVFTARYVLFSVPVFLIFAAYFFHRKNILFFLLLLPALFFDWRLLTSPGKARLPKDEKAGYLEEWTAGEGIVEIAEYLKTLPKTQKIIVGTEGFFGTLPDGLQIYLEREPMVTVIGVGYPIKGIPESLKNAKAAGDRVYLVVNESRLENKQGLRLIEEYPKPGGDRLLFFEI